MKSWFMAGSYVINAGHLLAVFGHHEEDFRHMTLSPWSCHEELSIYIWNHTIANHVIFVYNPDRILVEHRGYNQALDAVPHFQA
jgi:hypothetical protein